jgi:putative transposase
LDEVAWRHRPKHVVRDRNAVYGRDFAAEARAAGIDTLLTPFRSPRANGVAERVIRTLCQECPDHVLVLGERHSELVLAEDVGFYNSDRPHPRLGLTPPLPTARDPCTPYGPAVGRPVLSGLHHVSSRAA